MAETEQSEHPKANLPQTATSREIGKPITASNEIRKSTFERELFRNGTTDFNLASYVVEANASLERTRQWYAQASWDEKRATESFARDIQDAHYDLIWRQSFSGKIPRHWDIWYNVQNDFKKAREQKVTLSPTLVNAGITHPNREVVNEVGKGQTLDVRQMAWLFIRPEFPEWNTKEIIAAQRKMGVKDEDIEQATRLADEVRERMNEKDSSGLSLQNPPSAISSDI